MPRFRKPGLHKHQILRDTGISAPKLSAASRKTETETLNQLSKLGGVGTSHPARKYGPSSKSTFESPKQSGFRLHNRSPITYGCPSSGVSNCKPVSITSQSGSWYGYKAIFITLVFHEDNKVGAGSPCSEGSDLLARRWNSRLLLLTCLGFWTWHMGQDRTDTSHHPGRNRSQLTKLRSTAISTRCQGLFVIGVRVAFLNLAFHITANGAQLEIISLIAC